MIESLKNSTRESNLYNRREIGGKPGGDWVKHVSYGEKKNGGNLFSIRREVCGVVPPMSEFMCGLRG